MIEHVIFDLDMYGAKDSQGQIKKIYDDSYNIALEDTTEYLETDNYDLTTFEEFVLHANKIKYEEILEILNSVGETQVFEQSHKYFNTGKTDFNDHKEFLFLTKKYD